MEAFERDDVDVFVSMGGNFSLACSDTEALEAGMQRIGLTVHISTKPNRSHVVHGRTSLILPTLGRTDKDDKHPGGRPVPVRGGLHVRGPLHPGQAARRCPSTCWPNR